MQSQSMKSDTAIFTPDEIDIKQEAFYRQRGMAHNDTYT